MYKGYRILAMAPALNEAGKIGKVVRRVPRDLVDSILVIDDGSTDSTVEEAERYGATVMSLNEIRGAGFAIRKAIEYAVEHGYDIVVVMAGNNKDAPEEIIRLIQPIVDKDYDFVQGSRFLPGGHFGGMPMYRILATQVHPKIFSFLSDSRVTDSTNGFRAFKTEIFKDKRINLWQSWLDEYELEPYLYYKVIQYGYKFLEVPVTKIYPPHELGYTKMKPVIGWWSILKPLIYLKLGLRK
jgi:dolichol-phosphate mannosyltransferase